MESTTRTAYTAPVLETLDIAETRGVGIDIGIGIGIGS